MYATDLNNVNVTYKTHYGDGGGGETIKTCT
jgi:hypothetical protein